MKKLLLSACLVASVLNFISCKKADLAPAKKDSQSVAETQQTGRYATNLDPDEGNVIAGRATPGD